MTSLYRAGNYLRYIRSNWIMVAGSFVLFVMTVLVGMSFMRLGDVHAGYYNGDGGDNYNYGNAYAANDNRYNNGYNAYTAATNTPKNGVYPISCREGMYYNETTRSCLTVTSNPPTCREGMYYNETTRSCLTRPQTVSNANNYQRANYQQPYQQARNNYPSNGYGNNYQECQTYCDYGSNYGSGGTYPYSSQYPSQNYYPQPSPTYTQPAPERNVNNSPSATATANVVVNPALAPAPSKRVIASTVGYSSGKGSAMPTGMPIMLPETGTDNPAVNLLGIGGLVATGVAYISSRRQLADTIFKRN